MKQKILLTAMLIVSTVLKSEAQVKKIYAYSQTVFAGKNPQEVFPSENGAESKPIIKRNIHYLIYLEQKKSSKVDLIWMWIKGDPYKIKSEKIKDTPVELVNSNIPNRPVKKTLVPKTSNKVLLLSPDGDQKNVTNISVYLKKLIKENDLVVAFKWKNKKYYAVAKKINVLEPIAAM